MTGRSKGEPAVLAMAASRSWCSVCQGGADPSEKAHLTLLGWQEEPRPGRPCGVTWTHIRIESTAMSGSERIARARQLRPDLIPYGMEGDLPIRGRLRRTQEVTLELDGSVSAKSEAFERVPGPQPAPDEHVDAFWLLALGGYETHEIEDHPPFTHLVTALVDNWYGCWPGRTFLVEIAADSSP
jgi:hypothetical protein